MAEVNMNVNSNPDGSGLKEKVMQAGENNQKLSDVPGYAPGLLSHEENLHGELQLKLLHLAAWTGDVLTIEYLQSDADVTATTSGGFTPLHLAASRGHAEVLQLLLQWPDVDVEVCSSEGFTALHLAAFGGHYECVQALINRCPTYAHVSARDNVMGRTALHGAVCHSSSRKVFDLLLQYPAATACLKDNAGFTPLHFATMDVKETVLKNDEEEILLRAIRDRRVVDETPVQWLHEIFHDETKKPFLQEIQKSRLADRSPKDLIQAILEGIPAQMVKALLSRFPDQVNEKVGNVGWFLSMPDVRDFNTIYWRKLSGITTVHTVRKLESSMSGYTPLHFAACQNNAELVTHLLNLPEIKVNERDMLYGMTPLHCSLRTGSTKAFARLISFGGVDVNAQLVEGGKGDSTGSPHDLSQEFQKLETPLHLAIRFCRSEDFPQIMTKFCNNPKLNLAICNDRGLLPLQLAWNRSGTERKNISFFRHLCPLVDACYRRKSFARLKAYRELQYALDIMEDHPGNGFLMGKVNDQKKAGEAITNAILVSAVLLCGLTFQASIQQPEAIDHVGAPIFWFRFFSNNSFYFSAITIFYCLWKLLAQAFQKVHRLFPNMDTSEHNAGILLLSVSLLFGIGVYFVSDLPTPDVIGPYSLYVVVQLLIVYTVSYIVALALRNIKKLLRNQ